MLFERRTALATVLTLYVFFTMVAMTWFAQKTRILSGSGGVTSLGESWWGREDSSHEITYSNGTICDSLNTRYVFNESDPCCLKGLLHPSFSAHALQRFQESCDQVWYNKCMKSGSTLVLNVLHQTSTRLRHPQCLKQYTKYHSNLYFPPKDMLRRASVFASNSTRRPCIDLFHHFLVPFKKAGVRQPLIINVVRHPLSRLLSHYIYQTYYMGSKAKNRVKQNVSLAGTLKDCVEGRGKLLQCNAFFGYFCEDNQICAKRNDATLSYTKRVIEEYGIIIGLTEDLPSFWQLLEHLSPRFFRGVEQEYNKNPDVVRHVSDNTEIHNSIQLNSTQVKELPDLLAPEIQLYEFIRQKFYLIKDKVVKLSQQLVTSDQQLM